MPRLSNQQIQEGIDAINNYARGESFRECNNALIDHALAKVTEAMKVSDNQELYQALLTESQAWNVVKHQGARINYLLFIVQELYARIEELKTK